MCACVCVCNHTKKFEVHNLGNTGLEKSTSTENQYLDLAPSLSH